jgi:hypothetical protein
MIALMILGTIWIPLVGMIVYYRWKNAIKFYVVEFDGTKTFLGNKFEEQWKSNEYLMVKYEENCEEYEILQPGYLFKWPIEEEYNPQWINRSYLKVDENLRDVSDIMKRASGPGKHFGKVFNFQWLFGNEGELLIISYENEEIKILLKTNEEITTVLDKYNVKLEKSTTEWTVC